MIQIYIQIVVVYCHVQAHFLITHRNIFIAPPLVGLKRLAQPLRDLRFREGIHVQANRHIVALGNNGIGRSCFIGSVAPGDGCTADLENLYFHVDTIAVTQPLTEICLQMDCGKGNAVFLDNLCIVDPELGVEELLQSHMKVMDKTGIVDNTRIVNITKADFQMSTKSHLFLLFGSAELLLPRLSGSAFTVQRFVDQPLNLEP